MKGNAASFSFIFPSPQRKRLSDSLAVPPFPLQSHFTNMFLWGEDRHQGFRWKNASNIPAGDRVRFLKLSFQVSDLSAGQSVVAFIKTTGEASVIRTDAAGRVGKQKFVGGEMEAVGCGDDAVITLLSQSGEVFCVDTMKTPFILRPLGALSNIPVTQVACGNQHTVVLTKGGQVYTWTRDSSPRTVRTLAAMPLVQVAAGGDQSFVLSVSGGVFSWGRNDCGQLGLGDKTDRNTPTPVRFLNMKKTVHISCGQKHTAVLTKDGAVFTFGSGRFGQLGHNSVGDELRPRLVAELWGVKVCRIACGRHHTLVLTDSRKVFSFGCGEQGQLGHGEESHPSVPLPVQLPQDTTNGFIIQNIYAGANCSFATCSTHQDKGSSCTENNVTQFDSIENMTDKWASQCDSKSWAKIKQDIHRMVSSAAWMNRSFLNRSKDKHFQTSPNSCGLDLSLTQRVFEKLVKTDAVSSEVEAAVLKLLQSLDEEPVGLEGLRIFLILTELLYAIQKQKEQQNMKLAEAMAAAVQRLSAESLQIIGDWWSSLQPSTMIRHVQAWKNVLSRLLSVVPVPSAVWPSVQNVLRILQNMHNANKDKKKIPEATFGAEINQQFLVEDLRLWRATIVNKGEPLLLSSFPFVMDLKSKRMVFDTNASWTMSEHQAPRYMAPYGFVPVLNPYFELNLKRASLLEGTFMQLGAAQHSSFKKPLVVYFDGDTKVTDVYKRDFFHHLFPDLMSAELGMFMFNDNGTLAWFSSNVTEESRKRIYLFGVLCGLALYNQSMVYLPFPLVLFKKLLGVEPTLQDMMEFSTDYGRVLQSYLTYEDDVLENLEQPFSFPWDGKEVDLDPQNPAKTVTGQNKKEYVDACVNHAFNTSVESSFQEFQRGFFQVCERRLVQLFQPEELQGVLAGRDQYDWAKFKRNTVYEPEFHLHHPTIQMFWEVFDELTEDQKKDFLCKCRPKF
uniref:HECT domain-containing protein n=1 Tax=Amphiprion ocellaris TaxID=80972 RepID=A0AAQ5ZA97_AMPOC